jgi:hypothetical protein
MREAGVAAIVVLGGDGTHRAVVRESGDVPIAGLSTGTNNAFPEMRESTITALAVGLYATGRVSPDAALAANKLLEVSITPRRAASSGVLPPGVATPQASWGLISGGERRDIALVDAVISTERFLGARALWKPESLAAVYLAFAEPQAIGLSAIGALLHPLGRREPGGLAVELANGAHVARFAVYAPIAPGMVREVAIAHWQPMPAGRPFEVALEAGVVALDGERELAFDPGDRVTITLRENAFPTVDVARCMHIAAREGLFRHPPTQP